MSTQVWHGDGAGGPLEQAVEQRVALADHDPRWAAAFDVERRRLMSLFPGTFVAIEHIGSTPIAGLPAKPIIDLLAGVTSMEAAIALDGRLCASGYAASDDINRTLLDRRFFMRHHAGRRTHHLHVVVHGSPSWVDHVEFCRRLRDDPALRGRYASLKVALAARFAKNREAYTGGKGDFIQSALHTATDGFE